MLGMKTGFPLYVVGSSTFGTKGGYLMPGLLMGLLQVGWFAVGTFVSTDFILKGLGSEAGPGPCHSSSWRSSGATPWPTSASRAFSTSPSFRCYLNMIPLLMMLVVFFQTAAAIGPVPPAQRRCRSSASPADPNRDRLLRHRRRGGSGLRHEQPQRARRPLGGLVGITLAILVAGGLPLLSVAGAHGLYPTCRASTTTP